MASGASPVVVKAGYWFFGPDLNRKVAEIPSELFTHLYAGFAVVNSDGRLIIPEPYSELFRDFTNTVRVRNPSVKTLLSIGGEGADLSAVVASNDKRKNLITDSIDLAKKFHFDGLDLCWLYPSKADQEEPLASLLNEWRSALDLDFTKTKKPANKLLLTAAVFHHPVHKTFKYPIKALSDNLDCINVLAIDFYTPSNSPNETGPVHAWRTRSEEPDRCGSAGIKNWINGIGPNPVKIDAHKLVLGLPFYGYQWTLVKHDDHGFFAAAHDPANAAAAARLEFRIIQANYINRNAGRLVNDHDEYGASYWHHEASWIGFEDEHSIATKVKEAFEGNNLGGYVAWHLEADDDIWTLSNAASNARDNAMNNLSVTRMAKASEEGDINNDPNNTSSSSTTTSTTTTTTSTTTTTTTTTTTSDTTTTASVNICSIL